MVHLMELRGLIWLLISLSLAPSFPICDATIPMQPKYSAQQRRALKQLDPNNLYGYYSGSPFSLPPYQALMGPSSSPLDNNNNNQPPNCVYPPLPPSTTLPIPPIIPIITSSPPPPPPPPPRSVPAYVPNPPPPAQFNPSPPEFVPSPIEFVPGPPEFVPGSPECGPSPPGFAPSPPECVPSPPAFVPGPPESVPSPPAFVPGPPKYVPSPPEFIPSPVVFVPGPVVFQPPVVYPPPTAPATPPASTTRGLWCVAKPTVPDPIIEEAMNYACGSGADCASIQPNGPCFHPDTLIAHASFAFNSYWQRTKVAGGTCEFGQTAMLVTQDPSYDGCRFIIY